MRKYETTSCKYFSSDCFQKKYPVIIDCKRGKSDNSSSKMFFFLPSTTDRKESINRYTKNAHLHPIDCLYDNVLMQHKDAKTDKEILNG